MAITLLIFIILTQKRYFWNKKQSCGLAKIVTLLKIGTIDEGTSE